MRSILPSVGQKNRRLQSASIKPQGAIVRDYQPEDFEFVKRIHEASQIDYQMPDLSNSLFLVKKVVEVDGVVRAMGAAYIQCELYLFLDKSNWALPEEKLLAVKVLDKEVIAETWLKGVDQACLWLPPGMERFGERLTTDLGFTKDRDGWISYSKQTETKQ